MNPMAAARLAGAALARRGENPGELVVFGLAGNPGDNYTFTHARTYARDRMGVSAAKANQYARWYVENYPEGEASHATTFHTWQDQAKERNPKRRRNSAEIEQGVELYEKFHGSPVNEIVKLHESAMIREDYVACGPLIEMEVKPKRGEHYLLSFPDDGVMLACTPDGKQLYCIGGNQDVSECIAKLPGDPEKDFFHLGEVQSITYFDQKAENGHKPTEWNHALGEEGGERPHAMFDQIRKRIYFIGGDYRIEGPWIRN